MRSPWLHQAAVLREMGLAPLWCLRGRASAVDVPDEIVDVAETVTAAVEPPAQVPRADGPPAALHSFEPSPPTENLHVPVREGASGLNPQQWNDGAVPLSPLPASNDTGTERAQRIAALDWDELEADIRSCQACGLCQQRKQAVPGVGDRQAQWMLVGEGPGAEEDQRGEPFVGQAGRLLDNMLSAIQLTRQQNVYIANAVKCRPPHNRTPEPAEMAACRPYLERQIALVKPRMLVALGRPAAQALTGTEVRIGAARGRLFQYGGIPLVVTYHPAYLLRNPQDKAKAWEDLCFARRTIAELPE